jgi:quinol monooxygenase YgiN
MAHLEVIARAKVRPGQLEGVKAQAAEILRVTRELDTHTLRCDWFINEDRTECEVHEMFPDEHGLIEHNMHILEARTILFRNYAYNHQSTLYGDVSNDFLNLVKARMGAAPTVFSFLQGIEQSATVSPAVIGTAVAEDGDGKGSHGGVMANLELHAHLKIRPGQLDGFKAQAAEIMRLTRVKDTQTIRYDWFIDDAGTQCEVHEAYLSGEGLIEHNTHVMEARNLLFEKYAYDHRMAGFGEMSQELRDLANKHAGGIAVYSFFQGLAAAPAV